MSHSPRANDSALAERELLPDQPRREGCLHAAPGSFANHFMRGDSFAYKEIHMTLAVFFADFEMELFETDEKSMEWFDHGVASNASNVKVLATPTAT